MDISPEVPPAPSCPHENRQEDGGEEDGEGMESTPLTQGRYVERTHAGLISDAAMHMDFDF